MVMIPEQYQPNYTAKSMTVRTFASSILNESNMIPVISVTNIDG